MIRRRRKRQPNDVRCSFCLEDREVIQGDDAYICEQCAKIAVALYAEIAFENSKTAYLAGAPELVVDPSTPKEVAPAVVVIP